MFQIISNNMLREQVNTRNGDNRDPKVSVSSVLPKPYGITSGG